MNFTVLDVVGQRNFGDLQSLSLFDHGFIQVIHCFHLFEVAGQHVEDVLKFLFVVLEYDTQAEDFNFQGDIIAWILLFAKMKMK